jgi:serine/threonine-protein kinase
MSPEQLRGDKGLDERTDIFSVGVVLYLLLTGKHPFHAQDAAHVMLNILSVEPPRVNEIARHLSAHLADVVERSLAKDRDRRFQTMQEFHRALLAAPIFAQGNASASVLAVSDIVDARESLETHVNAADGAPPTVVTHGTFEDSVPSHPASVLPQRPSAHPRGRDRALLAIGSLLFAVAVATLAIALWMRTHESTSPSPPAATPPTLGTATSPQQTAPGMPTTPIAPVPPPPPSTPLSPPVTPLR